MLRNGELQPPGRASLRQARVSKPSRHGHKDRVTLRCHGLRTRVTEPRSLTAALLPTALPGSAKRQDRWITTRRYRMVDGRLKYRQAGCALRIRVPPDAPRMGNHVALTSKPATASRAWRTQLQNTAVPRAQIEKQSNAPFQAFQHGRFKDVPGVNAGFRQAAVLGNRLAAALFPASALARMRSR